MLDAHITRNAALFNIYKMKTSIDHVQNECNKKHNSHSTISRSECLPCTRLPVNTLGCKKNIQKMIINTSTAYGIPYETEGNFIILYRNKENEKNIETFSKLVLCTTCLDVKIIYKGNEQIYTQNEKTNLICKMYNKENIHHLINMNID